MATDRTAKVTWTGSLMDGSGRIEGVGSGAFGPLDVTWASRAEEPDGRTSPEELIAAAWASCFSMALSHALAGAGTPPERLETSATVTFQPGEGIIKGAIDGRRHGLRASTTPAFARARRGREGELPRLEGAHRDPRGHRSTRRSRRRSASRPAERRRAGAVQSIAMATLDHLVEELERSYGELQQRDGGPVRLLRPPRGGGPRPHG